MAVATRTGIPAFLMTVMVSHGAVAGALSPLAPTGIIARDRMSEIGLEGYAGPTFLYNLMANAFVAIVGYILFGGLQLLGNRRSITALQSDSGDSLLPGAAANSAKTEIIFQRRHVITLTIISVVVLAVLGTRLGLGRDLHVGMIALVAALVLVLFRVADESEAMRNMPWSVMLMVCGVTVLTSLLERTGGLDRLTNLVAMVSNGRTITGVVALVAGLVSVYSSTSGVVLPAFLPMTPGLVQQVGGEPLAIATAINVGGHLVDVSPLSTIGALCIASASSSEDRRKLFNRLLAWGLSMSVVGAVISLVFFRS
jgi:Na+/H+ antiporter NhaD/arsenite permease-like protein